LKDIQNFLKDKGNIFSVPKHKAMEMYRGHGGKVVSVGF